MPGRHRRINGIHIDKVINIDQSPIGRTPRPTRPPTPASGTMSGSLRRTPEARARGYLPGRFSFNVKGGRCEACAGDGTIKIEMHFLPDVYVPCEVCRGARYNRETLEILWKGHSVAEVLDMSVEEALAVFATSPRSSGYSRRCSTSDWVTSGSDNPATTLSGGEAQRIKLACRARQAFDRPDLLHPRRAHHRPPLRRHSQALQVLQRLVDAGNTVVVIEHNLDVIKSADWVIDLGPEGGGGGGRHRAAPPRTSPRFGELHGQVPPRHAGGRPGPHRSPTQGRGRGLAPGIASSAAGP